MRMHSDTEWVCEGVKVLEEGTLTSHTVLGRIHNCISTQFSSVRCPIIYISVI